MWAPEKGEGGGGPMKGFIFKSSGCYRMNEAFVTSSLHFLIKWCKIESVFILRSSCICRGYQLLWILLFMFSLGFVWCFVNYRIICHYDVLQFGLLFCVRVDTRAPYDWFYRLLFHLNFDVNRGWKMIHEFVHWGCYVWSKICLMNWQNERLVYLCRLCMNNCNNS